MSLKNILTPFAARSGLDAVDQRNLAVDFINRAATEIYSKVDPINCLREQVFTIDSQKCQITLPHYVGKIRGMREYQTGLPVTLHSMRPRFANAGWAEFYKYLTFRIKGTVPTEREITNAGPLTIKLPDGESADVAFSVYITGSNASKHRFTETVNFAVGDTEKTTNAVFDTVESFSKSAPTTFDVNMFDPDGVLLSYIANAALTSVYTILQIANDNPVQTQYMEVCYKLALLPFFNDFDEFPAGNKYDDAILWKSLEHYYSTKDGREEQMLLANRKCAEVLNILAQDDNPSTSAEINFGYNGALEAQTPWRSWYGYR